MRTVTAKVLMAVIAGAMMLTFMDPASAARRKRVSSETGPLIMSGTMVPPSMSRGSRAPEICRPVTIKRRPLMSLLSAR